MKKIITFLVVGIFLFYACDDDEIVELIADAGMNQQVKPMDVVTLDGSRSQGSGGFTYQWSYVGSVPEDEINFTGKNNVNPTFTPPKDEIYTFTLEISSGGSTSSDEVTIVASGAIEIGGTLTEDLILINVQDNPSLPDYIVTRELTVENGIKLVVQEDDVNILFSEGTGVVVKSGGIFTNKNATTNDGYECKLYGKEGWKGVFVEESTIFLNNATIENAGNSAFYGQDEAAALTLTGRGTNLESLHNNTFINSFSYDILGLSLLSETGRVITDNQFSFRVPIKAPITFMQYFNVLQPNSYPDNYDYNFLIPGGADKKDEIPSNFEFFEHVKYYIDGDFWAGKSIIINRDTKIFMKEGSGLLAEGNFNCYGLPGYGILIVGLNGANWKGIAGISTSSGGNNVTLNHTTIKNAGYGLIKMGEFEAEAPAALYSIFSGSLKNSEIINSGGFGYYNGSDKKAFFDVRHSLFENTALAAIRTNMHSVGKTLPAAHQNTFKLEENIAACLVEGDAAPDDAWYGLGDDNFYLIDGDILDGTPFAIGDGSILKFKAGRSLIREQADVIMYLTGSASKPVILDGEAGTPGSWGGIFLGGGFRIENAIIKNGGGFILNDASGKANIVSAIPTSGVAMEIMRNSNIANSAGYGIIVEPSSKDYEYESPDYLNTFTDNALGDIIR